jgi:hypothetical protein
MGLEGVRCSVVSGLALLVARANLATSCGPCPQAFRASRFVICGPQPAVPTSPTLTDVQKTYNKVHSGIRAIGERGNSLLKTTFKALRNVSICPWKIGKIARAALVLLHFEHGRTT